MTPFERIVANLILPSDTEEVLRPRLVESISLWNAGEQGIALESLCDNLHEFGVTIDAIACGELTELCRRFRVGSKRIALLESITSTFTRTH